jgi:hypothetical protein
VTARAHRLDHEGFALRRHFPTAFRSSSVSGRPLMMVLAISILSGRFVMMSVFKIIFVEFPGF